MLLPWVFDSHGNFQHHLFRARRCLHLFGRGEEKLWKCCQVFNRGAFRSGAGTLQDQWVQPANFIPKDLAGSELSSLKSSLDHGIFFHSHPAGSQGKIQIIEDNTYIQMYTHTHTHTQRHPENQKFKLQVGKTSNSFLAVVNRMLSR